MVGRAIMVHCLLTEWVKTNASRPEYRRDEVLRLCQRGWGTARTDSTRSGSLKGGAKKRVFCPLVRSSVTRESTTRCRKPEN